MLAVPIVLFADKSAYREGQGEREKGERETGRKNCFRGLSLLPVSQRLDLQTGIFMAVDILGIFSSYDHSMLNPS